MKPGDQYLLRVIGRVESTLRAGDDAPRQPDEGAPPAVLVFDEAVRPALAGLGVGQRIVVLTWLDHAGRDALTVHPRGDAARPPAGVFATRSPARPNPVGLHEVRIDAIDDVRVRVGHLEAFDGTPVVDVKPVLGTPDTR